jgi:YidC/Oxa1 family membrane protein insertase
MMYMMPGMFTVFMLFLPAGLGVYMFTNSVLAIVQQQVVEWHVARTTGIKRNDDKGTIKVTAKDEALAKSKASQQDKKGKG